LLLGELLTVIKIYSSISAPPECEQYSPGDRVLRAERYQPYPTVGREYFNTPFKARHIKLCQWAEENSRTILILVQVKVYPPGMLADFQ